MRKLLLLCCAALGLLLVYAAFNPADARPRHGFHGFRGGHFSGRSFHAGPRFYGGNRRFYGGKRFKGRRHAHRRYRGIYIGGPLYYGYDYEDSNYCYWLRRQAIITGNAYYWRRYHACIRGL